MTQGFWEKLPRPIFSLAPMADVTDAPFRQVIAKCGKADVMWTEFTSADGLMSAGRQKLLINFLYSEAERPIVAQIFSSSLEKTEGAARLIQDLGFDGIDINMGCPDRAIEKQGAGAALMKNFKLARELMQAAKRGAPKLPLSIKTRLGYSTDILEEWLPELLAEEPAAIAIHARTRKEMSKVPAKWERMKRAVEIRNELNAKTFIIGNGDVIDMDDARKKAEESGADGVMLGRAIFGNPWLFNPTIKKETLPLPEILKVLQEHTNLFEKLFLHQRTTSLPHGIGLQPFASSEIPRGLPTDEVVLGAGFRSTNKPSSLDRLEKQHGLVRGASGHKSFAVMKKHFNAYLKGFDGSKELRSKLMEAKNAKEVEEIITRFIAI